MKLFTIVVVQPARSRGSACAKRILMSASFPNCTPDDIHNGRVMSSQGMFDDALSPCLGLNYWEHECPNLDGMGLNLAASDGTSLGNDLGLSVRQASTVRRSAN